MALRVTQGMIYSSSIQGMNKTLSAYMESNLQSSSQKRINRPSDDPTGAAQVIASRNQLNTLVRYQSNINMAEGWLSTIDYNLVGNSEGSVQAILTAIKGLDLQGSTGTVSEDNRHQIASSLRQFYDQLITMANQQFNGNYVFGGHKTTTPPYVKGLAVDALDPNISDPSNIAYVNPSDTNQTTYFHVEGNSDYTVLIQAVGRKGGTPVNPGEQVAAKDAAYRYSNDGGKTWHNATVVDGLPSNQEDGTGPTQCKILAGGVSVILNEQYLDSSTGVMEDKMVTIVDPSNEHSTDNGTWLYVRPTAIYQGDDHDTQVVGSYGAVGMDTTIPRTAGGGAIVTGAYSKPVTVEITGVTGTTWSYKYSTDGGSTWTNASVPANAPLTIPGGELTLAGAPIAGDTTTVGASLTVPFGSQFPQAEGNFSRDVAVRIDNVDNGVITYSYSLDDGNNWTQTKAPAVPSGIPTPSYNLPVPGGYLNLDQIPTIGSQFNIHPHRADINLQISDTSSITVNMVGKEVFGGLYNYPGNGIKNPVPVTEQANLFEVIGRLIGFAETNSQDGFQKAMDELTEVMNVIVTKGAVAGGREDRLLASSAGITGSIYNEEERLSAVEDIDVTELMVKLAQQQLAYNSVLKSSSMIMQMSLVNFL